VTETDLPATPQPPKRFNPFTALGPGLVTGAADDDPSGIATYSQAGAQFGFQMLWTVVLTYPFMAVFQLICAEIARVSGRGLARNMTQSFPRPLVLAIVALLLFANTLNIAADLAAMGEVSALVIGTKSHIYTVSFALLSLLLQVFVPYHRYVGLLKWLTLALFAYVGVVLIVDVPWGEALKATVWPQLQFTSAAATMVVAVFGTTISPYLFFWQAAQEVEEIGRDHKRALKRDHAAAATEMRRMRFDTWGGMGFSNLISFSIIVATAATLHASGKTINSAADAAMALRPIAGDFAFALFAIGIIGTGLLAVPVLAGSAAYALSEVMGWRAGLELAPKRARHFYGVITIAILAAVMLDFSHVNPVTALFWSAVVNGVVAVPVMIVIMVLANRKSVMGSFTLGRWQGRFGWAATGLMAAASATMLVLL
jgi:Mn2+/Fe2+ NRAMP family transporter